MASGCRRGGAAVSLVASALICMIPPLGAQSPAGCNHSGGLTLSDRVSGTFSVTNAADGSPRLEAVILARGRPGWASEPPPSGTFEGPPPLSGGRQRRLAGTGSGALMLVYERDTGVAWVGNRPVRLGTDNVVLVDRADSVPVIIGTMHITLPFTPGRPACAIDGVEGDSIQAGLARDPSLRAFLMP
jgi:hypothetical protein